MDILRATEPWRQRPWIGYAVATVGPVLTLLSRLSLGETWTGFPLLNFLPAILLAWFLGSWRTAVVAVAVSTALGEAFLVRPPFVPLSEMAVQQRFAPVGFIAISAMLVAVLDTGMRSWKRLETVNRRLQQRMETAIEERRILGAVVDATRATVQVVDTDRRWIAFNKSFAASFELVHGVRPVVGRSVADVWTERGIHTPDASREFWMRALTGEGFSVPAEIPRPEGHVLYCELRFEPLRDPDGAIIGAFQFTIDMTEFVLLERQAEQARDALRQAQKAEALGQLTGGVAHDFNNMLQVILGNLSLARGRLSRGDRNVLGLLEGAIEGADRAAALTHRLLAYARQKPLAPVSLEINALVQNVSKLLRPMLGERIQLECVLGGGVWRTRIDRSELENALVNLAVNAKDAMPEGGKLTMETSNSALDDEYAKANDEVTPGQYVLIAVTDMGSGMTSEVISRAFDPFFTTKPPGSGTGLGLSQVHGFVKQSGGHVKIYSEPGVGTTVKLYLPRDLSAQEPVSRRIEPVTIMGPESAEEIILVVEDDPLVRLTTVEAFRSLGYAPLEAEGPSAALELLEREPRIDLLLTDVVMPEMSGSELAQRALERKPTLKVLYMTGYTPNAIVHNGVLDPGVSLLVKPFTIEQLRSKVLSLLR